MKTIVLATALGCGLLLTPASVNAASADTPMILAQFAPNGQRFEREREREPERRFENRDRRFERERARERERERRREFRQRERCEIVIVRKLTPFGVREERVRRCR